jgi:sterol 14-demethylase
MQHPEHFPPILAEQEAIIAKLGMTPAALRQLARLECCIKEAERLHPPLVMLMRKVIGRFEFNGHVLPIGDLALASSAVSHRNPKAFAEPNRYDPDRFAPPREEDRRTPFSLIGFGGGKHRCVGLAFAYQQIKVIWSVLLHRYEFELISPDQRPDYATFVVGPHQPCLVRYRRRMPGSGKTIAAAATLCTGNDEWIA